MLFPRPPSWFKGDLLLRGRGGKGEEDGREGKGRREEGKGWEGRGGKGRVRPPLRKFLDPPLVGNATCQWRSCLLCFMCSLRRREHCHQCMLIVKRHNNILQYIESTYWIYAVVALLLQTNCIFFSVCQSAPTLSVTSVFQDTPVLPFTSWPPQFDFDTSK